MKILVPLTINGNTITNVSLDTNDNNSVETVKYVKDLETKVYPYINNHVYREIFEHFYDSRETSFFNLIGQVSGAVVNEIKPRN